MIPDWAPNVHPMVVHFPIVLLIMALTADVVYATLRRPNGLAVTVTGLYVAGAIAAGVSLWTGLNPASSVFVPGMAHPLIDDHRMWALATTLTAGALAMVRVTLHLTGRNRPGRALLGLALAGLVVILLMQQTAERGARLVYEQGVGVIPAPVAQ